VLSVEEEEEDEDEDEWGLKLVSESLTAKGSAAAPMRKQQAPAPKQPPQRGRQGTQMQEAAPAVPAVPANQAVTLELVEQVG
jgi:hypothetical protein